MNPMKPGVFVNLNQQFLMVIAGGSNYLPVYNSVL